MSLGVQIITRYKFHPIPCNDVENKNVIKKSIQTSFIPRHKTSIKVNRRQWTFIY